MRFSTLCQGSQAWLSFVAFLFLSLVTAGQAQAQTGTVTGTLLEQSNGQPIPFANVVLLRAQDSTFISGAQTTETGSFTVQNVAFGAYTLRATILGYRPVRRALTLSAANSTVALGPVRLTSTTTRLKEVVVQGERAILTDNLDKKVIDVSKDLTTTGGSAVDVLQNVPSVTVDQSGAVSLRGSGNVTIFVDGKPTGAAGGGRSAVLDQIPASSIQSVEVVTNPSSRYDAEGTAGVINIILKKEKKDGINGLATVTAGTKDKYNSSLSLNARKGKLNVFGSYDFRRDRRVGSGTSFVTSTFLDAEQVQQTRILDQNERGLDYRTSHAGRFGFDYNLTDFQTITLSAQPRFNRQKEFENQANRQSAPNGGILPPGSSFDLANDEREFNRSTDYALDYRRTWKGQARRELVANAVFTPIRSESETITNRIPYDDSPFVQQRQRFDNAIDQASAQIDYVHPFGEKGRLEAGFKSILRQFDADYKFFDGTVQNDLLSNRFLYEEYIQAGYATYANASGKWSYQGGLRLEQTNTEGNQVAAVQDTTFTRNYLNLFPSAVLAYDLTKDQRLQLSYSRRLNRPGVNQLNPFIDRSEPLNTRSGNPALLPEYINSYELGFQKFFGQSNSFTTTAFYRQTNNSVQRFRQLGFNEQLQAPTTNQTILNLARGTAYGLELVGSTTVASFWKLNANLSGFRNIIEGTAPGTDIDNRNFTYTGRLNNNFTITKKLDVQFSANYRSAAVTAQGRRGEFFFTEFAGKYLVLKDRGSITLRVSDVFNTLRFNFDSFGPGFESENSFKRETRVGFLGFTYRFGGTQQPEQRRRRGDQQQQGPEDPSEGVD